MSRSPSIQVNWPAGSTSRRLRSRRCDRLGRRLGVAFAGCDRIRERAQVGAARCLEDVGGDALAACELAVQLEQHRDLAEGVAAAGDGADVVLLQARLVAGRGVERAEERVDRAVAGEAAL